MKSLVRVPIRTRAAEVTVSAWRLELTCNEGTGAIVLAEPSSGEAHYRGEGLLLGWPQERLSDVWAALLPAGDDDGSDTPQLG